MEGRGGCGDRGAGGLRRAAADAAAADGVDGRSEAVRGRIPEGGEHRDRAVRALEGLFKGASHNAEIILAGLLLAAAAATQNPMMGPWWETPIVRDSEPQPGAEPEDPDDRFGIAVEDHHAAGDLGGGRSGLAEMMGDDPVDPKKGAAAIEKVLTARTELGRQVAQMSLALRQILTASQWHELERRQRRNPGPNGLQTDPIRTCARIARRISSPVRVRTGQSAGRSAASGTAAEAGLGNRGASFSSPCRRSRRHSSSAGICSHECEHGKLKLAPRRTNSGARRGRPRGSRGRSRPPCSRCSRRLAGGASGPRSGFGRRDGRSR